jgi:IS30 family transposase
VAHCGNSASGDFASTLNITDLATSWTEQEAVLGKAEERVKKAIQNIAKRLPFRLRGLDPDNGSEFINWSLFRYCLQRKIDFTRGRPGKKNDNAHIEQKNWTHVRQVVGYGRFDTPEAIAILNALYRGPLRLYMNFFQPVMKLVEKQRIGGHLKRRYDRPMTPYQRVLLCPDISEKTKQGLRAMYDALNPVLLKKEIETLVETLYRRVHPQKQKQKSEQKRSLS